MEQITDGGTVKQKKDWMGAYEIARKIGVSAHTICRAFKRGKIKGAFKTPGGRYRIKIQDAQRYLKDLQEAKI